MAGLWEAVGELKHAGCSLVYLDGSFVTKADQPGDFDACWDVTGVDPEGLSAVFFQFDNGRAAQKARFFGEFFPAQLPEGGTGKTFLNFFQIDKSTGDPKGIVGIDLTIWQP